MSATVAAASSATAAGSPVAGTPPPTKEEINAIGMAIQNAKMELQRVFATGNIEAIKQKVADIRVVVKRLPEPFATIETVQTFANLASAFLHTGRVEEAVEFNDEGVLAAEALVASQPSRPEPLDLLSGALGAKVNTHLAIGKLDTAYEAAQRAFMIADKIFPKNDVRTTKSLRNLGVALSRKGEHTEGEKHLVRAHTIVCLASGAISAEAQMLTDDLVNLCTAKNDLEAAERYARTNFKKISEVAPKDAKEEQIIADSASRLGSILVKSRQFSEAETLIAQALKIREDNASSDNFNPLGVAYSLAQLAGIQEELQKITAKTEQMLIRALDIFASTKGQNSPEVMNTLNQLRSVRQKRAELKKKNPNSNNGDDEDEEDGLSYTVTSENKPNSNNSNSSSNHLKRSTDPFGMIPQDQEKIAALPVDNGDARLMLAQTFFQTSKFLSASIVLQEAFTHFQEKEGLNSEKTKMAKQNLMVSHMKRIDQLWLSVSREELLRMEEEEESNNPAGSNGNVADDGFASDEDDTASSATPANSAAQKLKKTSANNSSNSNSSSNESKGLTTEEAMFLRSLDSKKKQNNGSSCIIS